MNIQFISWCILGGMPLWAGAAEPIVMMYIEKPPYIIQTDSGPSGPFVDRTIKAFADAHIELTWLRTPPIRQFTELRSNKTRLCAANWFDTKERRLIARMSQPVIPTSPYVLIARSTDRRFHDKMSLHELYNPDLRMALSEAYSLGAELDAMLVNHKLTAVYNRGDDLKLLGVILAEHADYLFLFANEADGLLEQVSHGHNKLSRYTLYDMPQIPWTHFLCAFNIDTTTMERLNESLLKQAQAAL